MLRCQSGISVLLYSANRLPWFPVVAGTARVATDVSNCRSSSPFSEVPVTEAHSMPHRPIAHNRLSTSALPNWVLFAESVRYSRTVSHGRYSRCRRGTSEKRKVGERGALAWLLVRGSRSP